MLYLSLCPLGGDKMQQHCPLPMGQVLYSDSIVQYRLLYSLGVIFWVQQRLHLIYRLLHGTQCLTPWHFRLVWRPHCSSKFPDWLIRPWKSFQSGRPPRSRPFSRAEQATVKTKGENTSFSPYSEASDWWPHDYWAKMADTKKWASCLPQKLENVHSKLQSLTPIC